MCAEAELGYSSAMWLLLLLACGDGAAKADGADTLPGHDGDTASGDGGDTALRDTGDTAPHDTAPRDTGPHDTAPHDTGPHDTGPYYEPIPYDTAEPVEVPYESVPMETEPTASEPDDADGDGWGVAAGDCDDADPDRHPGAFHLDARRHWVGAVGAGAGEPALGDLDGDGAIDVVVPTDDGVDVLLGAGGFAFVAGERVAGVTGRVALGDLDGDGGLDLVVADGSLAVYRGRGDGTFGAPTQLDPGCVVTVALPADLEGDGGADLVVGCGDTWSMGRASSGGWTWTEGTPTHAVDDVLVADLDDDGDDDAVLRGHETLTALFSEPDGVRESAITAPYAYGFDSFAAGDFDADGDLDLAAGYADYADLWWFPQEGGGYARTEYVDTSDCEFWCAFAERLAALPADAGAGHDLYAWGDTEGTWIPASSAPASGLVDIPWAQALSGWAFADLDGDGRVDGLGVSADGVVTARAGLGAGRFYLGVTQALSEPTWVAVVADLDRDADHDLVTYSDGVVEVLHADEDAWAAVETLVPTEAVYRELVAVDPDEDGELDIVARVFGAGLRLFPRDGGRFTGEERTLRLASDDNDDFTAGDLDGDGRLDLVVVGFRGYVEVLLADGAGGYTSTFRRARLGNTFRDATLLDLDGDGALDLAVKDAGARTIQLFHGDRAGGFADAGALPYPERGADTLLAGDLDGDGDGDLVVLGSTTWVYQNEGGAWRIVKRPYDGVDRSGALVDLSGDGLPEIVVGAGTSAEVWRWRDGRLVTAGTLGVPGELDGTPPRVLDRDGDGHAELVFTVDNTGLAVYEPTCP